MTYERNPALPVFTIHVEPIGHWHVFKPKELRFRVAQGASAPGKTGLNLAVQVTQAGSSLCAVYSVENGEVKDEEDGVYAVVYCPSSIGSYALIRLLRPDRKVHLPAAGVRLWACGL